MREDSEADALLSVAVAGGSLARSEAVPHEAPRGQVLYFRPRDRGSDGAIHATSTRVLLTGLEVVSVLVMSVVASLGYQLLVFGSVGSLLTPLSVGVLCAALYGGAMHAIDANQTLRRLDSLEALRDTAIVWAATILLMTFIAFSLKSGEQLSRGAVLWFTVLGYAGLITVRKIAPKFIVQTYRPARFTGDQVIALGAKDDPALALLLSQLHAVGYHSPHVITFDAACGTKEWPGKYAKSLEQVVATARTAAHGDICIAASGFSEARLQDIIDGLQAVPRAVRIVPAPAQENLLHLPIHSIGNLRSIEVQRAPLNFARRLAKRAVDLSVASPLLLLFVPLFLLLALAIRLDSRGPVFFYQKRLGHRGRTFSIVKFRTMTVMEDGAQIKQAELRDQRVTRVGRWLRRLSLDELPQIINVIRGEMSLVGPRPHAIAHDQLYASLIDQYEIRQHVKPGITGWAQVNGLRGPTPSPDVMRKRVEFDIWYAKHAGFWLDIKILLLTIVEVFRQRNAF